MSQNVFPWPALRAETGTIVSPFFLYLSLDVRLAAHTPLARPRTPGGDPSESEQSEQPGRARTSLRAVSISFRLCFCLLSSRLPPFFIPWWMSGFFTFVVIASPSLYGLLPLPIHCCSAALPPNGAEL